MEIGSIEKYEIFIPTLAKWLYDQWGYKRPDGSISRSEGVLMAKPDVDGLPVAFIAVEDGKPVGIARLIRHDMENRKELSPWLASVFTPDPYRGRGIATALCKRVVVEAGSLGFSKVYLFTPNREAFYIRQGWKTIEQTTYRDENVVIMAVIPKILD